MRGKRSLAQGWYSVELGGQARKPLLGDVGSGGSRGGLTNLVESPLIGEDRDVSVEARAACDEDFVSC